MRRYWCRLHSSRRLIIMRLVFTAVASHGRHSVGAHRLADRWHLMGHFTLKTGRLPEEEIPGSYQISDTL